jgi:dienelactone hydrolase
VTRRQLLSLPALAGVLARPARPQDQFPGVSYRQYSRCLPDYLKSLAREAYRLRNSELSKLTNPGAIRERQHWVRETFWRLVGGMPDRTALNARTTGSFDRAGYRVEKVVYESRPKFYVTANLYVPLNGRPPYPGVLFQMGHSPNGKAADTYQRCCQGLVQLGYLVLAFDPMGQGERIYYPAAGFRSSRVGSADEEHSYAGKQMLLKGDTATRMQVWDAVRSLDYLAAHPMADPKRLASTGQSGGATLTMLLMAVDDRLAAAVECSGNTENLATADFNPPGATDDAEQNLIDSGPAGFERWDVMYPFAPKPLLITVSDKDFFGTYSPEYISNGWEEFRKLKRVYEVLGKEDQLAWSDTPLPHGLSYDSRLKIYNWLGRHLKSGAREVIEEPPVSPERDELLWATENGTVTVLRSETPFTLNRSRAVQQRPTPLDRLLRIDRPPANARATALRRVASRGIEIQALEIQSVPNVLVPAWLFLPKSAAGPAPLVLAVDPAGRNVNWHENEMYQELARGGVAVCAADVRGTGDLAPEFGRGNPGYTRAHQGEEDYAWASLMLGKPLVGQRVTDILAVAAALRGHSSLAGSRVVLAARGSVTVPATFAAALDTGIASLYLAGGLWSFASVVEAENYDHPLSNFVPNLLAQTDLPEVLATLSPRKVIAAGPVDGTRSPVRIASSGTITVREQSDWTAKSLAEFARL